MQHKAYIKNVIKCFSILLLIILADQALKLWVFHNMEMGTEGQINILGNVLKLTYVLNPEMAFSLNLGVKYGKLLVTTLRVLASLCILGYVMQFLRKIAPTTKLWGWILVAGGAIGNSIDSVLYGVYLDNAPANAPMKWFYGQVIDMIHVDLWSGVMPSWLPIWGNCYVYCLPVFNIADIAIFIGLLIVLCCMHPETHTTS
ncbi:signal peptidase II [Candidatus Cardinium hertigii]|uniref:signal peptidase II n=1 Tax=Candidatus Cardinium hertigii TaxID=247481 RepID=UPI0021A5CB7E|nr:signal peptidase II [Candidatus Cardinium hertigii]